MSAVRAAPLLVRSGLVMLGVLALAGCDALGRGVERMTAAARPADATPVDSAAAVDSVRQSASGGTSAQRPRKRTRPPKASRSAAASRATAAAVPAESAAPPLPPPPPRDAALDAMAADLRRLVLAQRQHFANQGEFSSRLSQLAIRYVPHAGVNVQIVAADANGWSARAVHEARPGWHCTVRGSPAQTRPSPVCDTTPPRGGR